MNKDENIDQIIKDYLANTPVPETSLPPNWERRFGLIGMFCRYDDFDHAESRNMITIRETGEDIPFGYVNASWKKMKENFREGDEIWKIGGNFGISINLIQDNEIVKREMNGHELWNNEFYVMLASH